MNKYVSFSFHTFVIIFVLRYSISKFSFLNAENVSIWNSILQNYSSRLSFYHIRNEKKFIRVAYVYIHIYLCHGFESELISESSQNS